MSERTKVGSVEYHHPGREYFEKRTLKRYAGVWSLWALVLQMISFVLLRRRLPGIPRPYVSVFGEAGAIVSGLIAAATLVALFANAEYRVGIFGVAAWYLAGVLYFAIIGRHKLVYSPEEDFALRYRRPAERAAAQPEPT